MRNLILSLLLTASPALAAPRVVTDIPPVHSLVAQVMEGVGEPALLQRPGEPAHGINLRPSQAAGAQSADLIFWIGPALSPALERPLGILGENARSISLMALPGTMRIEANGQAPHDDAQTQDHSPADPHVWLDPANARVWLPQIAEALAEQDPENAALYRANANRAAEAIAALTTEIDAALAPYRAAEYLATHRAFAYFEARFRLSPARALTGIDGGPPGPRAMQEVRRAAEAGVTCLIAEPETSASTLATLTEGTALTPVALDPLGRDLPTGPGQYAALLRAFSEGYTACLQ